MNLASSFVLLGSTLSPTKSQEQGISDVDDYGLKVSVTFSLKKKPKGFYRVYALPSSGKK